MGQNRTVKKKHKADLSDPHQMEKDGEGQCKDMGWLIERQ